MTLRWKFSAVIGLVALLAAVGGCSTLRLEARPNIPQPVIVKIPVSVALFIPIEFSSYVFKGERYGFNWEVALGAAQSEGVSRLMTAMFEKVVAVDNVAGARQVDPGIRAILEPAVEDFSFVTPRDAGTQFYAVSIKYRVSVYTPDGRLAESWPFTGYGIVPASGMSAEKPLARATALAMRDAGAKLVVEFREQAIIRGLLPDPARPDTLGPAGASQPLPSEQNPAQVPAAVVAPGATESTPPSTGTSSSGESAPSAVPAELQLTTS
jgi:hypothetical protein